MNPELREKKLNKDNKKSTPSEDGKKLNQKLTRRFKRSEQKLSGKQAHWRIVDIFDRNQHWKDVDLPPWIPTPVKNMVRYSRTLKRANLAGNIPAAHYTAINPEHAEAMNMLQKAYKHVWDTEKVPMVVRRCIDRSFLQGTAIGFVYSEDDYIGGEYYGENDSKNRLFQGRIRVKRYPIMNFFPDPDAYDLESCGWVDLTEDTTLDAIKKNPAFKEYAGDKLKDLKAASSHEDGEAGTILERDHDPFSNIETDEEDERVVLHIHMEMERKENGKKQLNIYYYLANTDFILLKRENVKPSVFPFAVLYDEEEENEFHGTGGVDSILEKQKLINKTEQTASIIGTLNQNPQKIIAKESMINAKEMSRASTEPGRVWVSSIEPSRAVHTLQPPDIPKGLFELKDRSEADIREDVGITEAYTGESVGSLTTSTGVNSLIERATIRDKDKMKQIDLFVEQLSDLIVLFIIEKWKEKRPIINRGTAGAVEYYEWDPEIIKNIGPENLNWFVKSDVYSSAPITQATRREQANNLLQIQQQFQADPPIITLEEWLHFQDFDNKDQILERMKRDTEAKKEREAKDFAQIVMKMAEQARQMIAQGQPQQEVMQLITEMAKEELNTQAQKQAQTGFNDSSTMGGRPRDAAKTPQGPNGDIGAQAMRNMTRGA